MTSPGAAGTVLIQDAAAVNHRASVGWGLAVFTAIGFSSTTPLGRLAVTSGINPTMLLAVRFLVATLLFTVTYAVARPAWLRIDRRGFLWCVAGGLTGAVAVLCYFWGLREIAGSIAAVIVSVYPLIVLGLLALRGEKLTYRNAIRVLLGLAGIYLLVGLGGDFKLGGVLLVLVAAAAYAGHVVLIQWRLSQYSSQTVAYYVTAIMTVLLGAAWLLSGAGWQDPGRVGWFAIFGMALLGTYLAKVAFYEAVRRIGGGQVVLLSPLETLLSVGWSILFLYERLAALQLLGTVLIIASAGLAVRRLGRVRPRLKWRAFRRP
ncbi:MAG: DMT family transporter [Anaerolineales bacterium]